MEWDLKKFAIFSIIVLGAEWAAWYVGALLVPVEWVLLIMVGSLALMYYLLRKYRKESGIDEGI